MVVFSFEVQSKYMNYCLKPIQNIIKTCTLVSLPNNTYAMLLFDNC